MMVRQPELFVDTARGRFAALAAGPADGPVVLCLHGFPDTPGTFSGLLAALAAAGFRAVAPWLRGYSPSPLEGEFGMAALGADLLALSAALGATRVVGHDWGALAVYAALAQAPGRLSAVVTLAVPHPLAVRRNLLGNPAQLLRSRYVLLFQLPGAESLLQRRDFAYVEALWRRWSPALVPPGEHLREVKATLRASGAAPLAHYRAIWGGLLETPAAGTTETPPLLYLAGSADGCIGVGLARDQAALLGGPYKERIFAGAGHFLHLERPGEVAAEIISWFRGPAPPPGGSKR